MSEATPQLDFEQRQRAALIAESRGIDDDTAHELVWLRDSHDALVAALKVAQRRYHAQATLPTAEREQIDAALTTAKQGTEK